MPSNFYKNSRIIDNTFYGPPRYINVDFSDIPGKEFIIQDGERLDIIAEQLWGDPTLWKALAIYNDIGYFFDVTPGTIIRIPFEIEKVLNRL